MNSAETRVFRARERRIRMKMTNSSKYLSKCCYFFPSEQTTAAAAAIDRGTQLKSNDVIQELNEMTKLTRHRTKTTGRAEVQSWRRSTGGVIFALSFALLLIILDRSRPASSQQLTSLIKPQQQHYNYQPVVQQAQHATPPPSLASDRCKIGPPLQWRPYLDASSKAYLAPVVALATLKRFNLTPIQLAGSGLGHSKNGLLDRLHSQQSMLHHAQSVNNVGVLIEATFQIKSLFRPLASATSLQPGSIINLHYKVDASLATTSDIIALYGAGGSAGEGEQQVNKQQQQQQNQTLLPIYTQSAGAHQPYARGHHLLQPIVNPNGNQCALELTEKELVKRGGKLFKVNQDYAVFLEQTITMRKRVYERQQQQQASGTSQQNRLPAMNYYWEKRESWHPFAAHEPMTNQTGRAIQKILCRNCVRAPTVQLVNSTFVSAHQDESARQQQRRATNARGNTIRLDCRVSGAPAPWVEWFRNGKLLRNKPNSRLRIKTSKVAQQQQQGKGRSIVADKLSRLEIDLQSGHNETGIYECRAMSVAAREPVVGTYTLLVMPAQYALIPMQQPIGSGGEDTNELVDPRTTSGKGERAKGRKSATTPPTTTSLNGGPTESTTATVGATPTTAVPAAPQSLAGPNDDNQDDDGRATPTSTSPPPVPPATPTAATSIPTGGPNGQVQTEQQRADDNNNDSDNEPDDRRVQIRPTQVDGDGPRSTRRPPGSSESGARTPPPPSPSTQQPSKGRGKSSPVVVGQPCPGDAHDSFCLNKGTCVLIGHIEEYFCNCAEGYHGHRCEYKSLGHQQSSRR